MIYTAFRTFLIPGLFFVHFSEFGICIASLDPPLAILAVSTYDSDLIFHLQLQASSLSTNWKPQHNAYAFYQACFLCVLSKTQVLWKLRFSTKLRVFCPKLRVFSSKSRVFCSLEGKIWSKQRNQIWSRVLIHRI